MSQTARSDDPIRPLSIGNVVSAGLRLYRSHLKQYFGLSVKAHLWILIPIYGWAKFLAISALISRLAFSELVNQPESLKAANSHVNPKLWSFLVAALLVGLILLAALIGLGLLTIIATVLTLGLLGFIAIPAFLVVLIWICSRYLITEVSLAVEENINATEAMGRSWNLTKGSAIRVVAIVIIAFLITLPLEILVQLIGFVELPESTPASLGLLFSFFILGLSLLTSAIFAPFWQAIKAVLYYDLRGRREGLGLQLRDR